MKSLEAVLSAINKYLTENGWTSAELSNETLFYYVDPMTGQAHRSDFAFFVQSERDLNKVLTKNEYSKRRTPRSSAKHSK